MTSVSHGTMIRMLSMGPPPKLEHGPDYDAVFGPYDFEGKEYFRYYDGSIEVWRIGETKPTAERRVAQVEDDDDPAAIAALNALAFLPAPKVPEELSNPLFRGPFWYGERQFLWWMETKEKGWKLGLNLAPPSDPGGPAYVLARLVDA